jgi:hypothetical protein
VGGMQCFDMRGGGVYEIMNLYEKVVQKIQISVRCKAVRGAMVNLNGFYQLPFLISTLFTFQFFST